MCCPLPPPPQGNSVAAGRTCRQLADCVEELELPRLLHIMDGVRYLAGTGLDVKFQPKAVDVSISCNFMWLFHDMYCKIGLPTTTGLSLCLILGYPLNQSLFGRSCKEDILQ